MGKETITVNDEIIPAIRCNYCERIIGYGKTTISGDIFCPECAEE